jgi:hypothetical protein
MHLQAMQHYDREVAVPASVASRSERIVATARHRALSEIFDVLLISAQFQRDAQQSKTSTRRHAGVNADSDVGSGAYHPVSLDNQDDYIPSDLEQVLDEEDVNPSLLDATLAQASMLDPPALAEAMSRVLHDVVVASGRSGGDDVSKAVLLSRENFIVKVEEMMATGGVAPINTFLTSPRAKSKLTSEDYIVQNMRKTPYLQVFCFMNLCIHYYVLNHK